MGTLSESQVGEQSLLYHNSPVEPFRSSVSHALKLAVNYGFERTEPDGHWYGELKYGPMETRRTATSLRENG